MNNEKLEDFMENLTAVAANTETCKSPDTVWCIRKSIQSRPGAHPWHSHWSNWRTTSNKAQTSQPWPNSGRSMRPT